MTTKIHIRKVAKNPGGSVPVGINGTITTIPVGVDVDVPDAALEILDRDNINYRLASVSAVTAGKSYIPGQGQLGGTISYGLNGVVGNIPVATEFTPTSAQAEIISHSGIANSILTGVSGVLAISGAPAAATVATSATFVPTITGGTAPYALSLLSGALPAGRSISGNTVVGTYTTAATYNYTLRVTDSVNATADLVVTSTVGAALVLSIDSPTVTEGDAGTVALVFTVSIPSPSASDVSVNVATSGGTATAGVDYTATSGTLTISAGQTSATVSVPVIGDVTNEGNETVLLTLSAPVNAILSGGGSTLVGTGTIIDNDGAAGAPTGFTYFMDPDGSRLTDSDGAYLMEAV